MQEQLASVRHGDRVLVDDGAGYEGRVIVVIGVIAVIRVRREEGGGETCRAAEVHRCRSLEDEADAAWIRGQMTKVRVSPSRRL
jgi:hypothetical protein